MSSGSDAQRPGSGGSQRPPAPPTAEDDKVYVPPTKPVGAAKHKTIEMRRVRLAADVDPRRAVTMPKGLARPDGGAPGGPPGEARAAHPPSGAPPAHTAGGHVHAVPPGRTPAEHASEAAPVKRQHMGSPPVFVSAPDASARMTVPELAGTQHEPALPFRREVPPAVVILEPARQPSGAAPFAPQVMHRTGAVLPMPAAAAPRAATAPAASPTFGAAPAPAAGPATPSFGAAPATRARSGAQVRERADTKPRSSSLRSFLIAAGCFAIGAGSTYLIVRRGAADSPKDDAPVSVPTVQTSAAPPPPTAEPKTAPAASSAAGSASAPR